MVRLGTDDNDEKTQVEDTWLKKNKNLTEKVYNRIMEMLLCYEIVPGQRLVFVDIAERLKVSRTPVNNALSIMAHEGYLDFVPNQGYSVRRISSKEAEDLFDIREVLEVGFIKKAVLQTGEKKLTEIEKYKDAYASALTKVVHRDLFVYDLKFHMAILERADNDLLLERYRNICQKIILCLRIEEMHVLRIKQNIEEHDTLFEALQTRDCDMALDAVKCHIAHSRNALQKHLGKV